MLRRLAVVAAVCAATLPFAAGPASASCLDDLLATDLNEGYTPPQYSEHFLGWVELDGLDVHVWTNDLLSDMTKFTLGWPEWAPHGVDNVADGTTGFVNCVAG